MPTDSLLPKKLVDYIHDMGVRALDHLAETYEAHAPAAGAEAAPPSAVATLVDHWKSMPEDDKAQFIEKVGASVVEVVAASAALPLGLRVGKKVAKAAGKVIRKKTKKLRKAAKSAMASDAPKKAKKRPKKKS